MGTREETAIEEESIQWFALLRDEDATEEDRSRFQAWLAADPRHTHAYRAVERIWGGLDQLDPAAPKSGTADISANVVTLAERRRRFTPLRGLAAAAVLLAAVVTWQVLPPGLGADYRSGVGERQTVRLEDGSQVELATASAMDVDFEAGKRTVRLVAGEAYFTVAPDPQRPFVVETPQGGITVLGTAFNVRLGASDSVAVTHNSVEVRAAGQSRRVTEGEMVNFGGAGVSAIEPADLAAIVAWRDGQIVFNDAPLGEVVAELQRYRQGRIQIVGDITERRVTAVFNTQRIDAALDTIGQSLGLRVIRMTGLLTVLM